MQFPTTPSVKSANPPIIYYATLSSYDEGKPDSIHIKFGNNEQLIKACESSALRAICDLQTAGTRTINQGCTKLIATIKPEFVPKPKKKASSDTHTESEKTHEGTESGEKEPLLREEVICAQAEDQTGMVKTAESALKYEVTANGETVVLEKENSDQAEKPTNQEKTLEQKPVTKSMHNILKILGSLDPEEKWNVKYLAYDGNMRRAFIEGYDEKTHHLEVLTIGKRKKLVVVPNGKETKKSKEAKFLEVLNVINVGLEKLDKISPIHDKLTFENNYLKFKKQVKKYNKKQGKTVNLFDVYDAGRVQINIFLPMLSYKDDEPSSWEMTPLLVTVNRQTTTKCRKAYEIINARIFEQNIEPKCLTDGNGLYDDIRFYAKRGETTLKDFLQNAAQERINNAKDKIIGLRFSGIDLDRNFELLGEHLTEEFKKEASQEKGKEIKTISRYTKPRVISSDSMLLNNANIETLTNFQPQKGTSYRFKVKVKHGKKVLSIKERRIKKIPSDRKTKGEKVRKIMSRKSRQFEKGEQGTFPGTRREKREFIEFINLINGELIARRGKLNGPELKELQTEKWPYFLQLIEKFNEKYPKEKLTLYDINNSKMLFVEISYPWHTGDFNFEVAAKQRVQNQGSLKSNKHKSTKHPLTIEPDNMQITIAILGDLGTKCKEVKQQIKRGLKERNIRPTCLAHTEYESLFSRLTLLARREETLKTLMKDKGVPREWFGDEANVLRFFNNQINLENIFNKHVKFLESPQKEIDDKRYQKRDDVRRHAALVKNSGF